MLFCMSMLLLHGQCCLQDVYKRLTTPFAFDGLLRLRCPPEFRVAAAHGHITPDPRHENLLLCGGCTPHDCMVLDLEYVKPSVGFSRRTEAQGTPVLQLVFQYSVLVPQGADGESPEQGEGLEAQLAGRCVAAVCDLTRVPATRAVPLYLHTVFCWSGACACAPSPSTSPERAWPCCRVRVQKRWPPACCSGCCESPPRTEPPRRACCFVIGSSTSPRGTTGCAGQAHACRRYGEGVCIIVA